MSDSMIRRYKIDGEVADDSLFLQTRETCHKTLLAKMKDEGFVPLLDLDPVWRTARQGESYLFEYTVQSVYVGTEDAWQYAGMLGTKLIPSTPKPKSKTSFDHRE